MLEAHLKEQISKYITGLITVSSGYTVIENRVDFGVDFSISSIISYSINGKSRFFNSGQKVDFQLKCTTKNQIIEENNQIKFDLKVNNYNDLIVRQSETHNINVPLILLIVILPNEFENWIKNEQSQIIVNAQTLWYSPNGEKRFSKNKKSVRIEISKNNQFNRSFLNRLFNVN